MESWDREWRTPEDYRGVNANMHTVEALLAVHEVTGDPEPRAQAARIVEHVVHGFARGNDWRLPEHFTPDWLPLPDYNRDQPADPFRPYGVTIGHLLEWSRLTLHLRTALGAAAPVVAARRRACPCSTRRSAPAGTPTARTGSSTRPTSTGTPVVRNRLHWVLAEGIGAAWALAREVDDASYRDWYAAWWAQAERALHRPRGRLLAARARPVEPAGLDGLGRASRTSTTPTRPPCCPRWAGRVVRRWPAATRSPGPAGLGLRGAAHPLDVLSPSEPGMRIGRGRGRMPELAPAAPQKF